MATRHVRLTYSQQLIKEPLIYNMGHQFQVVTDIRMADVDQATLEAAWHMGAWDVQRAEQPACVRPGAKHTEPLVCMQAFGAYALRMRGHPLAVSEAPDADELIELAARRGYLMWLFRPVAGSIWSSVKDARADATLTPEGRRAGPCPYRVIRTAQSSPACDGQRRTVYRLGVPEDTARATENTL